MKCKWGSCLEKQLLMRFLYCNRCKEKYKIAGRNLYIVFVDLQKHDHVGDLVGTEKRNCNGKRSIGHYGGVQIYYNISENK